MKLLDGRSIYYQIQNHPLEIGEKDLARIFDQVRFDPRLMEVATEFIRDFWWNLNPGMVNNKLKLSRFPYAIKPAILAIIKNSHFPSDEVFKVFLKWYGVVVSGIKNPNPQLFYIGLNAIGSKSMRREEDEALPYFTSFNLIAKDAPFNKGNSGSVKTKEILKLSRIDDCSSIKSELALNLRDLKQSQHLSNNEMINILGINRTFLSKILNNKLEGITIDYLTQKNSLIKKKFGTDPR